MDMTGKDDNDGAAREVVEALLLLLALLEAERETGARPDDGK